MEKSNLPDAHTQVQVSSEGKTLKTSTLAMQMLTRQTAADNFVNSYYQCVNSKSNLVNFYVNSSPRYTIPADISINGQLGNGVHYNVESLDAHVMNPSFKFGMPDNVHDAAKAERNGARMSIVVTAVGRVQFGKGKDAPQKMFNETFVLVPNWDAMARNPPRGLKKWLVMSQNFRAL
ncbi:hypothetical protein LLEC1_03553 [Akanthomyces lecanii]|uniref:NTF2 domain-containing protein n=1 Tax=Cordyceps confragosa TaxID=2714763 RepID=A0A179I5A6_CORDF|nr:hypothetical protein LLEC1_03553 [Akanthomyces lecanii]